MTGRRLNLGCGQRYHPDWVNVDFSSCPPHVQGADLRRGIPFSDSCFGVVYHSHVLEHFEREQAQYFLEECFRVLAPNGLLRVAVPDLEGIVRTYLDRLEKAADGDRGAEADYDWIMLEMYDQTVRTRSGGQMKDYLSQPRIPNPEFVGARMGWLRDSSSQSKAPKAVSAPKPQKWRRFLRTEIYLERLKRLVLGGEYEILQEGRFRRGGEIHAWMYDRFSLARLLGSVGFVDIRQCSAQESLIPNWGSYRLDTVEDGSVRKPDSLFMECRKS